MARSSGVDLERALDELERSLGGKVGAVLTRGHEAHPLARAKELLDRATAERQRWLPTTAAALRDVGQRLFEFADNSTAVIAQKATELGEQAYRLAAGPALVLGLLVLAYLMS